MSTFILDSRCIFMEKSDSWLAAGPAKGRCKCGLREYFGSTDANSVEERVLGSLWQGGKAEKSSLCAGAMKERREDDIIWK